MSCSRYVTVSPVESCKCNPTLTEKNRRKLKDQLMGWWGGVKVIKNVNDILYDFNSTPSVNIHWTLNFRRFFLTVQHILGTGCNANLNALGRNRRVLHICRIIMHLVQFYALNIFLTVTLIQGITRLIEKYTFFAETLQVQYE